jgi:hypothetical protein
MNLNLRFSSQRMHETELTVMLHIESRWCAGERGKREVTPRGAWFGVCSTSNGTLGSVVRAPGAR